MTAFTVAEDGTTAALNLVGNDTDIDGDTLSVQSIAGTTLTPGTAQSIAVTNGTVNVDTAGVITFSPATNYNGTISFDYVVTDGVLTDTATVSGTVTAVNDAPVAGDDSFTVAEDGTTAALNLVGNDTDIDGDTLSVQSIAGTTLTPGTAQSIAVTNGTVNVDTAGVITFSPATNYNGTISFDYVVTDGVLTDTATVSGTVTAVNDAPVAGDDSFTVAEDGTTAALNLVGNDTDIDGDTLSVQSIAGTTLTPGTAQSIAVTNGTVNVDTAGVITFSPATNYNGTISFDYVVTDGVLTDTATVSGTVTAVNDGPVAVDDSTAFTVAEEGTTAALNLVGNDTDIDGDTLSVQSIAGTTLTPGTAQSIAVTNGTVNVDTAGVITFSPATNYNGTISFDYVVTDGVLTDTATVSGTVTAVNDGPVAVDDSTAFTVAEEGTTAALNLVGNDTDIDGDTLSVQSIAGTTLTPGTAQSIAVTNGTVNVDTAGVITFSPATNYNGTISFDYVVTDGVLTDTATVSGTVTAVNDGPVAVDDSTAFTVAEEGTTAALNLVGNDTDIDGDTLSVQSIAGTTLTPGTAQSIAVTNGTVNVDTAGVITFSPATNYNGTISFDYVVTDGVLTDTATVSGTVTAVNDAPVAGDDSTAFTVAEDGTTAALNLVGNDTDIDGDTLSVQSIAGTTLTPGTAQSIAVTNGTVNVDTAGVITFSPATNYNGTISFDYVVTDGVLTDTATVSGTVTAVNDAPVAGDDSTAFTVAEDGTTAALNLVGNDTDIDGDTLSVQSIAGTTLTPGTAQSIAVTNGTVNVDTAGVITFSPATNYNGTISFDYVVTDGVLTDTATVSGTVTAVNDAPVAGDDSTAFTVAEDGTTAALNLVGNDTDIDGDTLSVQSIAGTTLTPGTAQSIAVTNGTVNVDTAGVITFSPATNYNGTISFDYVVTDGVLTDTATVSGTVTAVNDGPVAVDDSTAFTVAEEGTTAALNLVGNDTDIDGDTLSVQSIAGTTLTPGTAQSIAVTNGTVNVDTAGVITFSPATNYNGTISFDYVVTDGVLTDTATVSGTVTAVNDGPVAVDDSTAFTVAEEGTTAALNLVGNDTDIDGDTLSVQSIAGTTLTPGTAQSIAVTNGTVNVDTAGVITFSPATNYNGTISFDYVVTDGVLTDTATVSGTVTAVNDGPVAVDDSTAFTVAEEGTTAALNLVGNDTDIDGDTLSVQSIAGTTLTPGTAQSIAVTNGTVNVDTAGVITFSPATNYNGTISFDYVVTDGVLTDTATVSGTVTAVNDGPVAVDDSTAFTVAEEGTTAALNLVGNDTDIDGDTLSVQSIAGTTLTPGTAQSIAVTNGTVNVDTAGVITFSPATNYNGTISFDYVVTDGVLTDTATVSGTVTAVNDGPVAVDDSTAFTVAEEGTTAALNLVGNDTDIDGDTLSVQSIAGTTLTPGTAQSIAVTNGTVNVDTAGVITFSPATNYNGTISFDYVVTDGVLTDTATVSGTVTAVNDGPVAVDDSTAFTVAEEGTTAALNLVGNDTDIDGDTLSVQSIAGTTLTPGTAQSIAVTNGTVNVDTAGVITFSPATNYNGTISFDYVVTDGVLTDTATVSGTVTAVNDGPVAVDDSTAFTVAEEGTTAALNLVGNDTDIDGDTLSVQSIAGTTLTPGTAQSIAVTNGTVNVDTAGVITFSPATNYNGTISFDYVVTDGVLTDTATVSGTVTAVNDGPVAVDDSTAFTVAEEGTTAALNLVGNDTDIDGDTLSVQSIAGTTLTPGTAQSIAVTNGTVNVDTAGVITFSPATNYNGTISFDYVVTDGVLTDTATVSGTVTAVNDGPVAVDDSTAFTVAEEGTTAALNLVGNDTDIDGDTLSVQSIAGTTLTPGTAQSIAVTNGTVNVDTAGVITFSPATNYNGTISFDYVVTDGVLTDTATVSGTVTAVNDGPTITPDQTVVDSGDANSDKTDILLNYVANDGAASPPFYLDAANSPDPLYWYSANSAIGGLVSWVYNDAAKPDSVIGKVDGVSVITLSLNDSTGKYEVDVIKEGSFYSAVPTISQGTNLINAGQPTLAYDQLTDVVITGKVGDVNGTINPSNNNFGVNNGNFDVGESVTFTFSGSGKVAALNFGATRSTIFSVVIKYVEEVAGPAQSIATSGASNELAMQSLLDPSKTVESITIENIGSTVKLSVTDYVVVTAPPTDLYLRFRVIAEDLQGDTSDGFIKIGVDQNNDGVVAGTATLIDGVVSGMRYETDLGLAGYTTLDGAFSHGATDRVTFYVGSVKIGSIDAALTLADGKVFLQEIAGVGLGNITDDYVEKLAIFLQTLDNDGDAYNGIVITDEMHALFSDDNFDLEAITKEELVQLLLDNGLTPVDEDEAIQHVKDMITEHAGVTEFEEDDNDSISLLGDDEGLDLAWSLSDPEEPVDGMYLSDEADQVSLEIGDLLGDGIPDSDLSQYISVASDGLNTVIEVNSAGIGNTEGGASMSYTLEGVDLTTDTNGNALDTDSMNELLRNLYNGANDTGLM